MNFNVPKSVVLTSIVATAALSFCTSMAVAGDGKCKGLSGNYYGDAGPTGAHAQIVVSADGKTINIALAGGRPNGYGSCTDNSVTTKFSDDPRTTSGKWDGKTITWNNGSKWIKEY